jgi:hypothetical protein
VRRSLVERNKEGDGLARLRWEETTEGDTVGGARLTVEAGSLFTINITPALSLQEFAQSPLFVGLRSHDGLSGRHYEGALRTNRVHFFLSRSSDFPTYLMLPSGSTGKTNNRLRYHFSPGGSRFPSLSTEPDVGTESPWCVSIGLVTIGSLGYVELGHEMPGEVAEDYGWQGHTLS